MSDMCETKPSMVKIDVVTSNYHLRMDVPIENLAAELFGMSGNGKKLEDHKIVEHAIRKIRMLKKIVLATGLKENLLQVMMEE
jgi:inhibitor of KinA sporulation pathway (predicted exonuclease)